MLERETCTQLKVGREVEGGRKGESEREEGAMPRDQGQRESVVSSRKLFKSNVSVNEIYNPLHVGALNCYIIILY